jgi:hypothetical protein
LASPERERERLIDLGTVDGARGAVNDLGALSHLFAAVAVFMS